jgi:hypothetical protein
MQSNKRVVVLVLIAAVLVSSVVGYRAYRSHRVTVTQGEVDKKLDGLSAPARRSTPISLRPH